MGAFAASTGDSNRKTCTEIQCHIHKAVWCENGYPRTDCGGQAFNPEEATCCRVGDRSNITEGLSEKVSHCCELKAYNQLNEICCQETILVKPGPYSQCCGKEAYDADQQLCCGPSEDKKILKKESDDHRCCGHNQFNFRNECCCLTENGLKKQPINSSCCEKDTRTADTHKPTHCGEKAYDADQQLCCGPPEDKKILKKESDDHRCCGHNQFHFRNECCCLAENGLKKQPINSSCCEKDTLKTNTHKPTYCGEQAYDADQQLCCGPPEDKKILKKESNDHRCCGHNQFNFRNECCCLTENGLKKQPINSSCCEEHRGVRLQKPQPDCRRLCTSLCGSSCYKCQWCCAPGQPSDAPAMFNPHTDVSCGCLVSDWKPWTDQKVCCSSEHMEVLYSAKMGFKCCGHLYYNTSLWSCCAGRLTPVSQPEQHQNSTLLSLGNLEKTDLCATLQVGIVERVFLHCVVFNTVVEIHGRNASVIPLPSTHILKTPTDSCSNPKLVPGKSYFFDKVKGHVYIDCNHDSILQSIHFILSMCYSNI